MRRNIFFVFLLILTSCSQEEIGNNLEEKLLILRISHNDYEFIEGKEYSFSVQEEPTNSLPIYSDYQAPGDFGYMKFFHDESDELIFHGDIVWAGSGELIHPGNWIPASSYGGSLFSPAGMPSTERWLDLDPEASVEDTSHDGVWGAISHLNIVSLYMELEDSQIGLYRYTPSVGVGDPEEWSWILFLHRH